MARILSPVSRRLLARAAGPILLLAVGLALLAWTWKAWPDVVSDSGRELYLPWRLSEGDVLYRDVAHFNGPLSQYANALWFELVGVGFTHQVAADLLVLGAISFLLWRGGLALGDRFSATAAGLVFLCVFAFGPLTPGGSFSYLAPYSHEMTHGLLLLLLLPFCVARDGRAGGAGPPLAAGGLLGLLFLTKPELALAGLACVACGLVLGRLLLRGAAAALAALGALALGTAAPPLLAWALLATAMPAEVALRGTLGAWFHLGNDALLSMPYFGIFMGTHRPVASVLALLFWTLCWAAAFAVPFLLARWGGARGRGSVRLAAGLAAVPGALLTAGAGSVPWLEALRPLPVFLLGLLAMDAVALARGRTPAALLRLSVTALALVLLLKTILFARVWHYGFVLAVPGTLLLVGALLCWIPRHLAGQGSAGAIFRVGAASLLGAALVGHLLLAAEVRRGKTVRVGRGADTFWADGERGPAMAEAERRLRTSLPAGATLAVLPDGVMLNYLTRRRNSTPYIIGNPADVAMFGEGPMFTAYADAPPDAIALVACDTAIYGTRYFGQDYGQALARWIERGYARETRIGAEPFTGQGFGIVLLRRRSAGGRVEGP